MNARAACRLESLGFDRVYRYAPGKADWKAAGLPTEGSARCPVTAGDVASPDVPTCTLDATAGEVRALLASTDRDFCLVVSDDRVVLGRVRANAVAGGDEERVRGVMEEGPTTTRADEDVVALVGRLRAKNVASIVVTDPDGRLIGVVYRDDAERAVR